MTTVVFLHGRGLGPATMETVVSAFADTAILTPVGGIALRHGDIWFDNISTGIARLDGVAEAEQRLLA